MILSALGPDHSLKVLFLGTHTRISQWVTHHGIALARYSRNFGVLMEPKASKLPKGFVLGRGGNIHIWITLLGDGPDVLVGTLPARGLALIPFCHISAQVPGGAQNKVEWVSWYQSFGGHDESNGVLTEFTKVGLTLGCYVLVIVSLKLPNCVNGYVTLT
ncbi:hypothetical protein DVH24_022797 [Malus domestica]|uniref:Uncharacterized protein n=1 Tax=Malus domestica TaxID=3750 RepID=A0A498KUK5_MALDO|nr:hypothetical protein DVH24_022797 [Malus domestica]